MKAKTINSVLQKKFNEFVESIDDPTVAALVKKNTIITGGCIVSMLQGEKVNDFDLYFVNEETTLAVAQYYVTKFKAAAKQQHAGGKDIPIYVEQNDEGRIRIVVKSAGIANDEGTDEYQYFEGLDDAQELQAGEYVEKAMDTEGEDDTKPPYRPVFLSSNAITLSNKMQLIIRFYGDADEIHKNYDFVHCTSYWESDTCKLTLRPEALEAIITKELRYVGSLYPLCSIIRTRKFIKRGWTINAGQYLKMAMQLHKLDLTDIEVLEDQLVGVDVAYFLEVLDALKEKDPEKVDHAYLMEIIDRLF